MSLETRNWFLEAHARGYSRAAGGEAWSHLEDGYCADLSEAELRRCPEPGLNSIAWLLWYAARSVDVAGGRTTRLRRSGV